MTACQKYQDRLEALHDEELAGFARWRLSRHVAACPGCRAEMDELRDIAALVREDEAGAPVGPDLWAAISARLPEIDAELERRAPALESAPTLRARRGWGGLLGPLPVGVGGLAAAAIAVVLWLRAPGLPVSDDVVEELDGMGNPVAVLPSDDKSTIIWVLDPKPVAIGKESGGALL